MGGRCPGSGGGIRGTEFIVRLSPAARTLIIDLLEGGLTFTPRGGRQRNFSSGIRVIKWNAARRHRIGRIRAYRGAGDRTLARRRGYYDKILPSKRQRGVSSSGATGGGGNLSNNGARAAVMNPSAPTGRAIRWRNANGAHGSFTPATGLYNRGADRCRRVSFLWTRADRKRFAGTGWVCRTANGGLQFGVGHMTEVRQAAGCIPIGGGKRVPAGQLFHNGQVVMRCEPDGSWLRIK